MNRHLERSTYVPLVECLFAPRIAIVAFLTEQTPKWCLSSQLLVIEAGIQGLAIKRSSNRPLCDIILTQVKIEVILFTSLFN